MIGAMGHWGLTVELGGGWGHEAGVVQVCCVLVLVLVLVQVCN